MKTHDNVISLKKVKRVRLYKNNRKYLIFCGIALWLAVHWLLISNYYLNGDQRIYGVVETKAGWSFTDDGWGD